MRFYVVCPVDNQKIYVPVIVQSRHQLPAYSTVGCPHGCNQSYNFPRSAIFAEPIQAGGVGGAVAGGLIGLLAGPLGVILGAMAGGVLGGGAEQADKQAAERFNAEVVYP